MVDVTTEADALTFCAKRVVAWVSSLEGVQSLQSTGRPEGAKS